MSVIIIIILSFLISSAWLHYLRKIDLFEKERLLYIIITFILGAVFPFAIYPLHYYVYEPLHLHENGHYLNDFLYDVFAVGAIEEPIKFIPAAVALLFMKKAINEPLDYIRYTLVSALGFAFTENIEYCLSYGVNVLTGRSILAVPAHMFFSALFVYGMVLYKYQKDKHSMLVIPAYMLLSFVAHGLYDFTLSIENAELGILVTVMYFFVLMSVFVTILNNALNNSPFFDPKYVIDTDKLRNQVGLFYVIIIGSVVAAKMYFFSIAEGFGLFLQFVIMRAFILVVLIVRLCRFKLIQYRWNKLKFELPFYFQRSVNPVGLFPYTIRVRGDSFNEVYINSFYHEHFNLAPLSPTRSALKSTRSAYIESKFYLKNDETFFVVRITLNEGEQSYAHFLLRAKTRGLTRNANNEPIAALLSLEGQGTTAGAHTSAASLRFVEWVVLKKPKTS